MLLGGTQRLRHTFRQIATAAGRAVGGARETAYETWLDTLWERRALLTEEDFSVQDRLTASVTPREIRLSRIDPPPAKKAKKKNKRTDSRGEHRVDRFASLDPSARLRAVEKSGLPMVVVPGARRRYIVAHRARDRAIYMAYVALGYERVPCVVKRTRPQRDEREVSERVIDRVCHASMELCELLEAEALADEVAGVADAAIGSEQEGTLGDRPLSVGIVGQTIERLRIESALSYEALASLLGVQKRTVLDNAKGRAVPHPKTLKLYAEVFSEKLGRSVSVAELHGKTAD